MSDVRKVRWRVRLESSAERVYWFLATDPGREAFWAEKSRQQGDRIRLEFPNGSETACRILRSEPGRMFQLDYFSASTTFSIDKRAGATVLTVDALPPVDDFEEVLAGWVSVLLTLKAACDHGIDLRNHDREACWDQGFVDN